MTASTLVLNAASGAKADPGPDIDEIFSTHIYIGNGGTQDIENGIDLANEGGMLWIAQRDVAYVPILTDSTMTRGQRLAPNGDGGHQNNAPNNIYLLNNNGFSLRDISAGSYGVNGSPGGGAAGNGTYASGTFRKAEKFFDTVTYTGNGSNRAISHNLGTAPGMMWVKKTSGSQNWAVYHRGANGGSSPEDYYFRLNQDIAQVNDTNQFQSTAPTSTQFFLGTDSDTNQNGATYVAYLFAHNNGDGGFGEDGNKDVIKCGNYTGNGSSTGPSIDLGFEPQWVMIKRYNTTGDWNMFDVMRGMGMGDADINHKINSAGVDQSSQNWIDPTATGFNLTNSNGHVNGSGDSYLYVAIRRGPLNKPTDATKVFVPNIRGTGDSYAGNHWPIAFVPDMNINTRTTGTDTYFMSRLAYPKNLKISDNDAESGASGNQIFTGGNASTQLNMNDGWWSTTSGVISWTWKRAPSYFDQVYYSGTGSARTISHNLGVAPEMMWIKMRSNAENWTVYHSAGGNTSYYTLDDDRAKGTSSSGGTNIWNDTSPTSSVFSVGTHDRVNKSGDTYVATLFATAAGVSKLGSYTGTGSDQNIDCGFSSGARFVMVKRENSTGHWLIFDSLRGITAASNDPFLELDSTAAQDQNSNLDVDPLSSGFTVSGADSIFNASGSTYLFYAIA